jgi:hypothetical protein
MFLFFISCTHPYEITISKYNLYLKLSVPRVLILLTHKKIRDCGVSGELCRALIIAPFALWLKYWNISEVRQ